VTTSGSVPPTGKVNFTCGFNIGTIALNANGVASLTRLNLNADPYPLKAVYVGDANNLSSVEPIDHASHNLRKAHVIAEPVSVRSGG